jgi:hypothetical protein
VGGAAVLWGCNGSKRKKTAKWALKKEPGVLGFRGINQVCLIWYQESRRRGCMVKHAPTHTGTNNWPINML